MVGITVAMLGASISVALYLALSQKLDRATVQATLRQIEHIEGDPETARESALAVPFKERVLLPFRDGIVGMVRKFTPQDYVAKVRHQLVLSGEHDPDLVDKYLAKRLLALLALPGGWFLAFNVLKMDGSRGLMIVALLAAAAIMGPSATLNRKIAARREAIQATLPDVLDLLTISVEAGLGFEQALDRTVDAVPGPLSDELGRMLGEMRAGARRAEALRSFDERVGVPDVHSFTLAILQADTFGVSITRVLRSQADEMRIRRRQMAQEKAQKAPVKMLLPMVFCIFPSLFVIVLGPAAMSIMENFK